MAGNELLNALVASALPDLPPEIDASLAPGVPPAGSGYVHVTGGAYDVPAATIPNADVAGLGSAALQPSSAFDAAGLAAAAYSAAVAASDPVGAAAAAQAAAIAVSAQRASNLTDLASPSAARTALGLGGAAVLNVGAVAGTVAAGDDARLSDTRTPSAHKTSHQDGGSDEINVGGLSGVLADPQPPIIGATGTTAVAGNDSRLTNARTPTAHATSHQDGGTDEISVTGLSGVLADPQPPIIGATGTTAVAGNDSRLTNARTPTAHATSHNAGGSDALAIDAAASTGSLRTLGTGAAQAAAGNDSRLSDARTPTAHKTSHQVGGSDALNVGGLSGQLADPQPPIIGATGTTAVAGNDARLTDARTPTAHATTHLAGGSDSAIGLPIFDATLNNSETIGATQRCVLFGQLTIAAAVTLTIASGGQLILLALPYGT